MNPQPRRAKIVLATLFDPTWEKVWFRDGIKNFKSIGVIMAERGREKYRLILEPISKKRSK